jgi:phospholipid/cholesterol/gamma-HCH transport system substrate-binding protein
VLIREASKNAKELTNNLNLVSYNLKDSSNLAGVLFYDKQAANNLKLTVENLQSGTKKFDEDMEALQHSFLFRDFFKKKSKTTTSGTKKITTNR